MWKIRLLAGFLIIFTAAIGYLVYESEVNPNSYFYRPFKLGLDLKGGSHLVYEAKTDTLNSADIPDAMESLRDVIDRRINAFGVAEPLIQVEHVGLGESASDRLVVELPGVTDLKKAQELIGQTPTLEFKTERPEGPEKEALIAAYNDIRTKLENGEEIDPVMFNLPDPYFVESPLTGKYLKKARVEYAQQAIGPSISVEFNAEGAKLFAEITKNNIGRPVGIYLDGVLISSPVVRDAITTGQAEISGQFTLEEAKELTRNLNLGALPVEIDLLSTETVGATLGSETLADGIKAGLIGFLVVAIFMILWYRVPGLAAIVALAVYAILVLALFKLIGVTITAAGIAGLILSFGLALDANILISERLKEELQAGRHLHEAIREGFARAWFSIRDANLASLISAVVLFWLGTSMMKGFAVTLLVGILVSMFTAISVTRVLLIAVAPSRGGRFGRALFKCGFN